MKLHSDSIVEELNQLLKGTHMGAYIFEDLRGKLKGKELIDVFNQMIENLHQHEEALCALVISEGGEASDSAGLKGSIADMMASLKNMSLTSDKEVLKEAIKSMEMGIKAIHDFDESHYTLKTDMQKTIRIMEDDYTSYYHMLHKYSIEYK
ncbi:MAG: DUF2383 domain-containing protein [Longicatena sp.]